MSAIFHVGQAHCLRTNVHSHAPQVRQRNMRTANAICGRDAKCSLQLTQFHLICDSDLTQTHRNRNRIAQVLCNGPLIATSQITRPLGRLWHNQLFMSGGHHLEFSYCACDYDGFARDRCRKPDSIASVAERNSHR